MDSTYFLVYFLVAVVTTIFYFLRKNYNYFKDRGIPYDKPHSIYGSLYGIRKTRTSLEINTDIYKRFKGTGPFCGMFFFMKPAVFVLETELAKEILIKNFSNFADRGAFYNERDDPLTGHLFALDGAKWKELRHKLSPTFTSGKMKFMFPTIVTVAERFVEVLTDLVSKGDIIEIKELCARFTTDVIGTCAFGIECNSLKDPKAEFRLKGRDTLRLSRHGPLITGLMTSFPNLARKLHMHHIHEDIHQFFMRVVRETVNFREQNKIQRNDFMDLLIELKNTKSIKTEDGEVLTGLTIEEVAAQAFVFFLAGFETSSTTMGFALYELARHQDLQDKVRQEINEVLAKHEQKFTYECVKDLTFLRQIISETLRLYTIVPMFTRRAINNFVVPQHPKYRIEKGTLVVIPAAVFHRDPQLYTDPDDFKPERFSPEKVAKRDSVEWLAFGDGPRNCIGKRFGEMQAQIGLALLLKKFKFLVCDRTQIPIQFDATSFLLTAKGGIELRVKKVD